MKKIFILTAFIILTNIVNSQNALIIDSYSQSIAPGIPNGTYVNKYIFTINFKKKTSIDSIIINNKIITFKEKQEYLGNIDITITTYTSNYYRDNSTERYFAKAIIDDSPTECNISITKNIDKKYICKFFLNSTGEKTKILINKFDKTEFIAMP